MPDRAAFYIDGFNLYHAIDDLAQPHLKWLDLWFLCQRLIDPRTETLTRVLWCTATITDDVPKMLRHRAYLKALESTGVIAVEGHFIREEYDCDHCQKSWWKRTEKEGDVNVAINLISDAHRDLYDVAYLLTADSDQAATAKMLRETFAPKRLISVAPPGRQHSKHILQYAHGSKAISIPDLESSVFLGKTVLRGGAYVCDRPDAYAPPRDWRHPRMTKVTLKPKSDP